MKGITIIEEHLCRVVEMRELIGIGIFITLLCIGVLAFYRYMYKNWCKSKRNRILMHVCSLAIIVMLVVSWAIQISKYNTTHYEYTIEVDNSVYFNDFFDRYEIVSVDGDRYRVKEIDQIVD
jgi:hypothetical protein